MNCSPRFAEDDNLWRGVNCPIGTEPKADPLAALFVVVHDMAGVEKELVANNVGVMCVDEIAAVGDQGRIERREPVRIADPTDLIVQREFGTEAALENVLIGFWSPCVAAVEAAVQGDSHGF